MRHRNATLRRFRRFLVGRAVSRRRAPRVRAVRLKNGSRNGGLFRVRRVALHRAPRGRASAVYAARLLQSCKFGRTCGALGSLLSADSLFRRRQGRRVLQSHQKDGLELWHGNTILDGNRQSNGNMRLPSDVTSCPQPRQHREEASGSAVLFPDICTVGRQHSRGSKEIFEKKNRVEEFC